MQYMFEGEFVFYEEFCREDALEECIQANCNDTAKCMLNIYLF